MATYNKLSREDVERLRSMLGPEGVSTEEEDLVTNSIDAFAGEFHLPDAVVWPRSADEVASVLAYASERRIPVTVRAAGTSLTGSCVPQYGGILMNMMRMNRILEVRPGDMQVDVEPAVVYEQLNRQLEPYGLFFPPDPGSSKACTIGGMVANNASGLKAVRYGVTRDYVLALRAVFPNGLQARVGCNAFKSSIGYDLVRLLVGSEGTLGVITEITLRLRRTPRFRKTMAAYFDSVEGGVQCVNKLRLSGLEPAAIEFLDRSTIEKISSWASISIPIRESMLIIEFHGSSQRGVEDDAAEAIGILRENGCVGLEVAENEAEAERIWEARRGAYPSILKSCRSPVVGDIVVPLSRLVDAVKKIYELSKKYQVPVAVFGHLGDGNIHPNWLSDRRDTDHWERANRANYEVVKYAIDVGGAASAEHGIGIEKKAFMEMQHGEMLGVMKAMKQLLDPAGILNPGIMFEP